MPCSNGRDFGSYVVHGGDVYRNDVRLDFSVSLNPLEMPADVRDAMMESLDEVHQYPDPFYRKLRERIAEYEQVSPDEILCGNGASELIMAAVHAVMPKNALFAAPCYAGYARCLAASGAKISEYMLREENEFALDDGFKEHIHHGTDMVFITDPNNPDGRLIDPVLKQGITEECRRKSAVLLIDECFLPLSSDGMNRCRIKDTALHLRAFTKTLAIPGLRIGYLISKDKDMLNSISIHLPEWNISRIAERAGEAAANALADPSYLKESVRVIERERAFITENLRNLGIMTYPSDTNYILMRSTPDMYDRLLERGMLIRKCANFSGLDDSFFRISVRNHKDNEELIKAIGEIL